LKQRGKTSNGEIQGSFPFASLKGQDDDFKKSLDGSDGFEMAEDL